MRRKSHGYTLLELLLVVGLLAIITLLSFYSKQVDLEQSRARQIGGYLYQYNNAVRSALAQGLVSSTTTKVGTSWLKNSSCGGVLAVGSELLPCDFPVATNLDPIKFGRLSLSTAVVVSGAAPSKKYQATTITSPFTLVDTAGAIKVRSDLAGIATLSAAAALSSGFQVGPSGGLSPFTATTDSSYKADPISGVITIVASNTANNDVWLRTDGGNTMRASLGFSGTNPADRQILGASGIQNLAGEVLRIGAGSGLAPVTSAKVVIDSATEVLGDFKVRKTLVVDNSVYVTGDIVANAGSVRASGDVTAGANISAGGSMSAIGNLTVNGQVTSNGNVTSLSQMAATGNITSQSSVVAMGNVNAGGAVVAPIFYDSNNNGYYVDPHATSNLNTLAANYIASNGRIRATEFLELGGIATVGGGCSPLGLIARAANGEILSCKDSVWTPGGGASLGASFNSGMVSYHDSSNDQDAFCPDGSVLVGLQNRKAYDSYILACRWLN